MFLSVLRRLRQLWRRIHVRVVLFAVLALMAAGGAALLGQMIPANLGGRIGAQAVDDILSILASSMLAVTTFSLTIMLSAMNNAAAQWTPRSQLILRQDTVTHGVLANFLDAFLFALIAVILRAAGLFDDGGMVVLFVLTLLVVAVVLVSLIRWIVHLEGLGSLTETLAMLEREARLALRRSRDVPCHGGHALTDPDGQIPSDAWPLTAHRSGYLEQVFEEAVQAGAEAADAQVFLTTWVGQFVVEGAVLAWVRTPDGASGEGLQKLLREALPLADARSFEQDLLFGLTVLAEVGTRALSPGVNDPGTAIDVVNRLGALVAQAGVSVPQDRAPSCSRLWAMPLSPVAVFEVSFAPLAHCAGDTVDVHLALQSSLRQVIAQTQDAALRREAELMAQRTMQRAQSQIAFPPDLERLRAAIV